VAATAKKLSPKQVQSYLMRTTGPQQYFSQAWQSLATIQIPKNIPLNQPLAFLQIQWSGRVTTDGTGFVPGQEAPQNILQNVQLQGTHNVLGSLKPINMSGATLFAMNRLLDRDRGGNSVIINGTRMPDLGQPMGLTAAQFGAASTTYDVNIFWLVPFFPYGVADHVAVQYLLNAQAWGQTLQLEITAADQSAWGTGALAHSTLTAFGSNSGSPVINLNLVYVSLGDLQNSIAQAVCVRNVTNINSILQSNANGVRLVLLQNQRTMNVIQKTGTSQAGTSAGVSAFATLSDTFTEQTIIRVNNNPIRNLQFNAQTKEFYGQRFNTVLPTGYLNISFVDGQPAPNVYAAVKGDQFPGGAQFDIAANIQNANAANVGEVVQDMIYGEPVVAGASS
jgi:hypothetical protein